jgi:hypothetical protein
VAWRYYFSLWCVSISNNHMNSTENSVKRSSRAASSFSVVVKCGIALFYYCSVILTCTLFLKDLDTPKCPPVSTEYREQCVYIKK